MIEVVADATGCTFGVKAKPSGRRNEVLGEYNGAIKVAVAAHPQRGEANDAILDLLAERLRLPRRSLSIVRGRGSPSKRVHAADADALTVRARLNALVAAP
jgi:uncharacterized protein YggU (UPF0235/DUF167 family)